MVLLATGSTPLVCLLVILLSFFRGTSAEVCREIFAHGVDYQFRQSNGVYHFLGVTQDNYPYYRHTSGLYDMSSYYGYYWIIFYRSSGAIFAYTDQKESEEDPDQAPGPWEWDCCGRSTDFDLDCMDGMSGEFFRRHGKCVRHVMWDIAVENPSFPMLECDKLCQQNAKCTGYYFDYTGCYPQSESCAVTDAPDYYPIQMDRDLFSRLILDKQVYQSSVKWEAGPERASDGSLNDNFMTGDSCTHTLEEAQPWWAVDLGAYYTVQGVSILNRRDCCEKRLDNFYIRFGENNTLSEVLPDLHAKKFEGTICRNVTTSQPSGKRKLYYCNEKVYTSYMVIHRWDKQTSILTLCEVEVLYEEVGKYVDTKEMYSYSEAEKQCKEDYNGSVVDVGSMEEWDMLMDYIDPFYGERLWIGTGSLIPTEKGPEESTKIQKQYQTGLHSISCLASSEADDDQCEKVFDDNEGSSWVSAEVPGDLPWIQLDFIHPIEFNVVYLMQRWSGYDSIHSVNLTFEDGSVQNFELLERLGTSNQDGDGQEWDELVVEPVLSSYLLIEVNSMYYSGGVAGLSEVVVRASESRGVLPIDGDCLGHDLEEEVYKLGECNSWCLNTPGCTGYVYMHDGPDQKMCYLKNQKCAPSDMIDDPDATYYEIHENEGFSIRDGYCESNQLANNETFSLQECLQWCRTTPECRQVTYCFYGDCASTCVLQHGQCTGLSNSAVNTTFYTINKRSSLLPVDDYIGCYWEWSPRDMEFLGFDDEDNLTNADCITKCAELGYEFAGTQDGIHCNCDHKFGLWGSRTACTVPCAASEMPYFEPCGQPDANSIYSTAPTGKDCRTIDLLIRDIGVEYFERSQYCGHVQRTVCETYFDFCLTEACENGATCQTTELAFVCICASGYTGMYCEMNIDDCELNNDPCVGGTCIDRVNSYECRCDYGYTGTQCETDIDECVSDPCLNNGICEDSPGRFTCNCVDGYTGQTCHIDTNECSSYPCLNAATCTDKLNGYECHCRTGYSGETCAIDTNECESSPCENLATCEDHPGYYICICVKGYEGANCETKIDSCSSSPCLNGATCNSLEGKFTCDCASGFAGLYCDRNVDECASDPCKNQGQCKDGVNSFQCICVAGYEGHLCQDYVGNPGTWSEWVEWGSCTESCGDGLQIRERACIPKFPELGRGVCSGEDTNKKACFLEVCAPVDGKWGAWEPVTTCPENCDMGIVEGQRGCNNPPPQWGGKGCTGITSKLILCQQDECEVRDNCGVWGEWGECSGDCSNGGTRQRQRLCFERDLGNSTWLQETDPSMIPDGAGVPDVQSSYCLPAGCSDMGSTCPSCSSASSGNSPNCESGAVSCGVCMTTYSSNGNEMEISKTCGSSGDCDKALDDHKNTDCASLVALSMSTSSRDGSSGSVMQSDLKLAWGQLDAPCSVCCQGLKCNQENLPKAGTIKLDKQGGLF